MAPPSAFLNFWAVAALLLLIAPAGEAGRSLKDVSDDSPCVIKKENTAMKPLAGDWDEDHSDLKDCFADCQPEDGYSGISYNGNKCYCWKGNYQDEWVFEDVSSEDSYVLIYCDSYSSDADSGDYGDHEGMTLNKKTEQEYEYNDGNKQKD